MIIKATRVKATSGAKPLADHVLRGRDNQTIAVLAGTEADIDAMVADARRAGCRYAIRHFALNPHAPMAARDAFAVVAALGREFGFDPSGAVVVEHQKRRQDGGGYDRHWHALVGEFDPVRQRVLDSAHMFRRQEKIARLAEIAAGHTLVPGAHNKAVVNALRAEGNEAAAARIEAAGLIDGARPRAAFSTDQHQAAKRRSGENLAAVRAEVCFAWGRTTGTDDFRQRLLDLGYAVMPGDKPATWLVCGLDGVLLGALHRLLRLPKHDVHQRIGGDDGRSTDARLEGHVPGDPRHPPGGRAANAPPVSARSGRRGRAADADARPDGRIARRHAVAGTGDGGGSPQARSAAAGARLRVGLVRQSDRIAALCAQAKMMSPIGLARRLQQEAAAIEAGANRPTNPDAIVAARLPAAVAEVRQQAWEAANVARLAVEEHARLRPIGAKARLTGALARWAGEHRRLQCAQADADGRLDLARVAEDTARLKLLPSARMEVAANVVANRQDFFEAARLRQIASAVSNRHFAVLASLRKHPLRLLDHQEVGRLHAAASSEDWPVLEGEGFDAVARFFRHWSAAMTRAMKP